MVGRYDIVWTLQEFVVARGVMDDKVRVGQGELFHFLIAVGPFADGLTNQIAEYRSAVESLQGKLKEAYGGIQKQNEAVKELVAQRDEFVQKLNDSVKERNDIVAKYNDLAAQAAKLQGGKQ